MGVGPDRGQHALRVGVGREDGGAGRAEAGGAALRSADIRTERDAMSDRTIVLTDLDQRRLRALALEVPGDVWNDAVGRLLERETMPAVACVLCALGAREDPEDERARPGIYVVNGQSVCE